MPGDEPFRRFFVERKYRKFNNARFNLVCDVINVITVLIIISALLFVGLILVHALSLKR